MSKLVVHEADCWLGREVEGQLAAKALLTVFVARQLLDEQVDRIREYEIEHIFFVEGFAAKDWFAAWDWARDVLLPRFPKADVTVALRPHELDFRSSIAEMRVVVRALENADWIDMLLPGDEVSIGQQYDLATWKMSDGVRTVPSDYQGDFQLSARANLTPNQR